jgi:hypothetical protein
MPDNTGQKQDDTRFKPGQSGNPAGRPRGARNKLTEDFFKVLADDFAKHGKAALEAMRIDKPSEYVRAVVALQSKEITGEDGEAIGLVTFKGLNG